MRPARPHDSAPRAVKCPVDGCDVRIAEDDLGAQVAHMNELEAAGDVGHIRLIGERTRGR